MQKKLCWLLFVFLLILSFAGCSRKGSINNTTSAESGAVSLDAGLESCITDAIFKENSSISSHCEFKTESHVILGKTEQNNSVIVYAMVLYEEYTYHDNSIQKGCGSHMPVAMTFQKSSEDGYTLSEFWVPEDGDRYSSSIKKEFPADLYKQAINTQNYIEQQQAECDEKAKNYFADET